MDEQLQRDVERMIRIQRRLRILQTHLHKDILTEVNVTLSQHTLMAVLSESGECRMAALSEALGLSMGSVTPLADKLIATGLVERRRSADDRRLVLVKLTAKGRKTYAKVIAKIMDFGAQVLDQIDAETRRLFLDTYQIVLDRSLEVAAKLLKDKT